MLQDLGSTFQTQLQAPRLVSLIPLQLNPSPPLRASVPTPWLLCFCPLSLLGLLRLICTEAQLPLPGLVFPFLLAPEGLVSPLPTRLDVLMDLCVLPSQCCLKSRSVYKLAQKPPMTPQNLQDQAQALQHTQPQALPIVWPHLLPALSPCP